MKMKLTSKCDLNEFSVPGIDFINVRENTYEAGCPKNISNIFIPKFSEY